MRRGVILLGILLVACAQAGQPAANAAATPGASSAASPKSVSCRLPISIVDSQGNKQGAFVEYPSGKVIAEAAGRGGGYYDRQFKRWLPASPNEVSWDGKLYAYLERWAGLQQRARLHVVDVGTGKDKLYELGTPGNVIPYAIVDFAPEGIWMSYHGYESPGAGLFLLDLATGTLKNPGIPGMVEIPGVGLGIAGGTLIEPVTGKPGDFWFADGGTDPQVAAIGFTIPARVLRLTPADGKTEPWFSSPGMWVRVLGVDAAGHPLVATSTTGDWATTGETIWLASSPSEARSIQLPPAVYQLIADSHGVWFGSKEGIYLYSDNGGLQKFSNQPGYPANGCF